MVKIFSILVAFLENMNFTGLPIFPVKASFSPQYQKKRQKSTPPQLINLIFFNQIFTRFLCMQGGKSPRNEVIEFSTYAQYLKLIWNFGFYSKNCQEKVWTLQQGFKGTGCPARQEVLLSLCPRTKKIPCPAVPLTRDKKKSLSRCHSL